MRLSSMFLVFEKKFCYNAKDGLNFLASASWVLAHISIWHRLQIFLVKK